MLVDSHCHLNYEGLKHQIDEIVNEAESNGVGLIQTVCTKEEDIQHILDIISKYKQVYGSIGIHPNNTTDKVFTVQDLDIILKTIESSNIYDKITSIGETGLDYYRSDLSIAQKNNQRSSFCNHINVAKSRDLCVIIHTRSASDDTLGIINEMKSFRGVIHCFTETMDFAKKVLDLGLYISFSGICTFKNSKDLREIVEYVPLNRILIETDSPFLAPEPFRGKTNRPAYVKHVAQKISEIKKISFEEVSEVTTKNYIELFKPKNLFTK